MPSVHPKRRRLHRRSKASPFGLLFLSATLSSFAQTSSPAATSQPAVDSGSIPAGVAAPAAPSPLTRSVADPDLSPKAMRDAEFAYLRGARALDHQDLRTAEREFHHATELNPRNRDYALALAVLREHRLTDLVQRAATEGRLGHTAQAETLLLEARTLDPQNAVVRQHFEADGNLLPFPAIPLSPQDQLQGQEQTQAQRKRAADARSLAGPVEVTPAPGRRTFHVRGGPQEVLRALCSAFNLRAEFDSSVTSGELIRFDLEDVTYPEASRVAQSLTHTFLVPLEPKAAFFSKDTPENRAQFEPLIEETLLMPGTTPEVLAEYANLARNVFNLRVVNAVTSSGGLVLRGTEETLQRVNATFDDLIDGEADVLVDLTLYEIDSSHIRNLGAATPSSIGVFPVAAEAQSLITANQSLINAAIASNQIVLTGNPYTDALTELGLLLASGVVSSSQFSNLLGVFGHYAGLPLAGVFLGSATTVNASLNSTDIRILDRVQLRAGNGQNASFRAGTRYPIETGIYSSGAASALPANLAGLNINGTSVSSLLSQYLGSGASASVPQVQFEDLGLTLKATPQILRSEEVSLKLDLKVEALGSGTINTLPVLNSRALTSQVTIPAGQTALIASLVDKSELRSVAGLPFLTELPGFGGTDKNVEVDKTELLITLTPHVVRKRRLEVASRRLLLPANGPQSQGTSE